MRWFTSQLEDIGYVEYKDGLFAIPPTEADGLILGDAIEIQLRSLLVSRVLPDDVTADQRSQGVEWGGQAVITFEYRDRYHLKKQALDWSEWVGDFWVLTLVLTDGQWTVKRVS